MAVHWIEYGFLALALLAGVALNAVLLPGLWLMVGAAGVYAVLTRFAYSGWKSLLALALLAAAAELVELLVGGAGAKRAGGGRAGVVGAVVGGMLGAIFFTGLIPVPVLGTVVGVCLGSFVGAGGLEYLLGAKPLAHALRIGAGAAKGRFLAILTKIAFGVVMLAVALWTALPLRPPAAGPAAAVATAPPAANQ